MLGQLAADVHDVPVWILQFPATTGQLALLVQTVPVWTLQKPAWAQSVLT
jgi:hypothetical protein